MKNKTLAVWLTLTVGVLGLHRLYLGRYDWIAKFTPFPTFLGLYGVLRVQNLGVDDRWSWVLIPFLGFILVACALNALFYGLMSPEKWNTTFNPGQSDSAAGNTNWRTVIGLVAALAIGTTVLMATLAFTIQRTFEYQIEQAREPLNASQRNQETSK